MRNFRQEVFSLHLLWPSCCLKNYHKQERLISFHRLQAWQASTDAITNELPPTDQFLMDGVEGPSAKASYSTSIEKAVLVAQMNLYHTHMERKHFSHFDCVFHILIVSLLFYYLKPPSAALQCSADCLRTGLVPVCRDLPAVWQTLAKTSSQKTDLFPAQNP